MYYIWQVLLHNVRKIDVNIRNCRERGRAAVLWDIFLRLTAVPRSTLRLRHARPSSVYARTREREGGGRGGRGGSCYAFDIECNSLRNSPFPNSVKVSHVRA